MYFWVLYLGYVKGEREGISCRQVSVITLSHHLRFARICSTLWAFEENINVCVLVICNSLCMENSCISREILRALRTKRTLALKKPFFQRCQANGRTCRTTRLSLTNNPVHVLCPGPTSSAHTTGRSSVLFVRLLSQLTYVWSACQQVTSKLIYCQIQCDSDIFILTKSDSDICP